MEKHQIALKAAVIKVKTSKHHIGSTAGLGIGTTISGVMGLKKAKKRKHSEMSSSVSEQTIHTHTPTATAIAPANITTTTIATSTKVNVNVKVKPKTIPIPIAIVSTPSNVKIERSKKSDRKVMNVVLPVEHKKKVWKDYIYLYDGKEKLAQLHFECMEKFRDELIERCVEEEYIRIMQLRNNDKNVNRPRERIRSKFESSTESTPENNIKINLNLNKKGKKKIIQESESSDECCQERDKKKKIDDVKLNRNIITKLQTLTTLNMNNNNSNKKDDLKTPQSPVINSNNNNNLQPKIPNISYNNSIPTPTNTSLPFNLPQISFPQNNNQSQPQQNQRAQPPPPVIKPLFSNTSITSDHNSVDSTQQLSVSQPMAASYPSQQLTHTNIYNNTLSGVYTPTTVNALNANATPQYMPIYPTPIHTYTPYHNVNVNVNTNMNQL
eukprot:404530_1